MFDNDAGREIAQDKGPLKQLNKRNMTSYVQHETSYMQYDGCSKLRY